MKNDNYNGNCSHPITLQFDVTGLILCTTSSGIADAFIRKHFISFALLPSTECMWGSCEPWPLHTCQLHTKSTLLESSEISSHELLASSCGTSSRPLTAHFQSVWQRHAHYVLVFNLWFVSYSVKKMMNNASSHKVANLSFLTDCHRTGHIWLISFILKDSGCYSVTDVPFEFRHKKKCVCASSRKLHSESQLGWIELDLIIDQWCIVWSDVLGTRYSLEWFKLNAELIQIC